MSKLTFEVIFAFFKGVQAVTLALFLTSFFGREWYILAVLVIISTIIVEFIYKFVFKWL